MYDQSDLYETSKQNVQSEATEKEMAVNADAAIKASIASVILFSNLCSSVGALRQKCCKCRNKDRLVQEHKINSI